jgi:hypothetical protein
MNTGLLSNKKQPIHELTEEEQLQAAIRASMKGNEDDSDDDVEVIKSMGGVKSDTASDAMEEVFS